MDYSQGDAFFTEKRTIFSTSWLPVGVEAQIPKPGDFMALAVGGWSVVAVRDKENVVRVLRNTCRHQNMPVVGTPSGNCESFRCRFHGWTYDLEGKFVSAPPPVAPADPTADLNLQPLDVATEAGLLFFNLESEAPPPQLGPLPAYGGTIATEIACNWKVAAEHLLGERRDSAPGFAWHWPLLAVRRAGLHAIVEQIVPHTFLRTRLLTHVFGAPADDYKQSAATIKHVCERLQADRAAGTMAEENVLVADFHRRLDEAYAEAATSA
ncbi:MAG TPA: Rieske (2Fe-2S) protein [Reyranella sp.]|nr:Rieske (2Fe-2S) protein [Reyranella sp.]